MRAVARGLDPDGFIVREPELAKLQPEYAAVLERLRVRGRAAAGEAFHSLYLSGSVATGRAVPGRSDLDALLLLTGTPQPGQIAAVGMLTDQLVAEFPVLSGAGILLDTTSEILSPRQRYDMGFFVKCFCVGIAGEDLFPWLPAYRPSLELAAGTNGNIGQVLAAARQRLAAAGSEAEFRAICRGSMRKIVRTGFTLVMPREPCWINDLAEACAVFGKYYPAQAREMANVLQLARTPSADRAATARMLMTFGAWLVHEYEVRILSPN